MKIDPNGFYLVIKPHHTSEMFDEVFVDAKRNLADLNELFDAYKNEGIHGLYSNRDEAFQGAKKLWNNLRMGREDVVDDTEARFKAFVKELTKISNKYQVAIQSTGGVTIFKDEGEIRYDEDHTSGDLRAFWGD